MIPVFILSTPFHSIRTATPINADNIHSQPVLLMCSLYRKEAPAAVIIGVDATIMLEVAEVSVLIPVEKNII